MFPQTPRLVRAGLLGIYNLRGRLVTVPANQIYAS